MCPTLKSMQPYTIESTKDARISETILLGWLSLSFMMLSMTESSVAVVSCKPHNQPFGIRNSVSVRNTLRIRNMY